MISTATILLKKDKKNVAHTTIPHPSISTAKSNIELNELDFI